MTNLEGRVIRRRRARPAPEGVWTDVQVLAALAERLGCTPRSTRRRRRFSANCAAPAPAARRITAGITYARIDAQDGVFWPCTDAADPGTPRLFLAAFRDGGWPRAVPSDRIPRCGRAAGPRLSLHADDRAGCWPITRPAAQTRRVPELAEAEPDPFCGDPRRYGARPRAFALAIWLRLTTRRASIVLPVRGSPATSGSIPFLSRSTGAAGSASTLLTKAALDPISRIPEFKACAVHVAKADAPRPPARAPAGKAFPA